MDGFADYDPVIRHLVKDNDGVLDNLTPTVGISDAVRYAVNQAVKRYSKDRPLIKICKFAGADTYDYAIDTENFLYWKKGFSWIKRIEYPADEQEPDYLEEDEWMIIEKEDGIEYLRFLNDTPTDSENIRVNYSTLHIVSDSESTVFEVDEEAVCNLAASICCEMIAGHYAATTDPTITADTVNYRSKSGEWLKRAKGFRDSYNDHIKPKEPVKAAGYTSDKDKDFPWGQDKMTHPRKWR